MIYNPIPPESTTFAFLRAGKRSGVLSSITLASTTVSPKSSTISVALLFTAPSEAALTTERIVPSVGFITALYAALLPSTKALASSALLTLVFPSNPLEIPLSI